MQIPLLLAVTKSLCFRAMGENIHVCKAEASHKTQLLLSFSGSFCCLWAISCSQQRQKRDGAGRELEKERGKH